MFYNVMIIFPLTLYIVYFGGGYPAEKIVYLPVVLLFASVVMQQLRIFLVTNKEVRHLDALIKNNDKEVLFSLLRFPMKQSIVIAFSWVGISLLALLSLSVVVSLTSYLIASILVSVLVGGSYISTVTYFVTERGIFELLSQSQLKDYKIDKLQNPLFLETSRKILMITSVTLIPFSVLGFFVILAGNFQVEFNNLTFHFSIIVGLLVLAIVFVVYESFLPTKQGILNISNTIENLEKGKLSNQALLMSTGTELGFATQNVNIFRQSFRKIISTVLTTSGSLGNFSSNISQITEKISSTNKQQVERIKEMLIAITELSFIIKEAAEHSQESLQVSLETAKQSQEGENLLLRIVKEMQEVAAKVSLVQEVANQTNLLSLNAAIEAARSGQHGRGFAVVAGEITKLAESSNHSAKEITELIYNTLKHSEIAKDIFTGIVPKVEENARLLQEVANWGKEQQTAINQIKDSVNQLDTIASNNAQTSSSVAQIAHELKDFSQQLIEQVKFFEVQEDK